MTPYQNLVAVLDRLRHEAPASHKSYYPDHAQLDQLNSARSRAFLHLYLKVKFGLLSFDDREPFITEGADDGGIDAYFIDSNRKIIFFLQAKFRTTEKNFEAKAVDARELLLMDIARILEGEALSESGKRYNSKILQMARRIREIPDIGRYNYRVILLANVEGITKQKLVTLTGGFPVEVFDHKRCYSELLFPLISGTYYKDSEMQLSLNLSNKSAGAKISYTVSTESTDCEITVIFVPTLEIAKAMFRYRNSILKYNPRSYLGHEGQDVNAAIRSSIENRRTNEFALFNNGITILSDETHLNERIGQKGRAQLVLVNPQIINGGQTAYTLSIVYRDHAANANDVFENKEVLVKIITFQSATELSEDKRIALIEDISRATNQQTAVTTADRRSNEASVQELQRRLFERSGLFLERKRGEFEDGRREGYIRESEIIDRTLFFRAALAAQGKIGKATRKRLTAKMDYKPLINVSDEMVERYAFAVLLLSRLLRGTQHNKVGITGFLLVKVHFGLTVGFVNGMPPSERNAVIEQLAPSIQADWERFETFVGGISYKGNAIRANVRTIPGPLENYLNSSTFQSDVGRFLESGLSTLGKRNGLTPHSS